MYTLVDCKQWIQHFALKTLDLFKPGSDTTDLNHFVNSEDNTERSSGTVNTQV
jgi:hypothetical protein